MYKQCKTEQSAARQRELAFGLLDLMQQMPYEKITVNDLCRHTHISRKTFYRYFPSKNDALEVLVYLVLMDINTYKSPALMETDNVFLTEMTRFFYYWLEHRQILETLLNNSLMEVLFTQATFISLTEMALFKQYLGGLDFHARESVAAYYVGGILSMIMIWLKNQCVESPEDMSNRVIHLVGDPDISKL